MTQSQFGGIFIPREVLQDENLTTTCKILYGFVQSLDGQRGCFAQNSYLAGLIGTSEETVRASLYILEKKGYIARFRHEDGARIIRTRGTIEIEAIRSKKWSDCNTPQENLDTPPEKSVPTPPEKSGVLYSSDIPIQTDSNDKGQIVDYENDKDFKTTWKEFCKFRRKMKRPMTELAEKLVLKKLAKVDKDTAIKALELSIERSWIGVFPEAIDYSIKKNNGNWSKTPNEPLTDGDHVSF